MADHNDVRFKAGQAVGQAQVKKDEMMDKVSQSARETKEQAGGFLQQTGEQMKDMAQGATDAIKNSTGMANNDAAATTTTTKTTVKRH